MCTRGWLQTWITLVWHGGGYNLEPISCSPARANSFSIPCFHGNSRVLGSITSLLASFSSVSNYCERNTGKTRTGPCIGIVCRRLCVYAGRTQQGLKRKGAFAGRWSLKSPYLAPSCCSVQRPKVINLIWGCSAAEIGSNWIISSEKFVFLSLFDSSMQQCWNY